MRAPLVAMSLLATVTLAGAGCQIVFPLDGPPEKVGPDAVLPTGPYIIGGDYDGDMKQNADDPCPLLANEPSTDSDLDGLPDACDPDVGVNGRDCIVLLDTFDIGARTIDPRWTFAPSTPDWDLRNCDSGPSALCSPRNAAPSTLYFNDPTLRAARVDAELVMDGTAGSMAIFYSMTLDSPGVTGNGCGLERMTSGAVHGFAADVVKGAFSNVTPGVMTNSVDDATYELNWRATQCGVAVPFVEDMTYAGSVDGSPFIGLYTDGTEVDLHWIVAYGTNCP